MVRLLYLWKLVYIKSKACAQSIRFWDFVHKSSYNNGKKSMMQAKIVQQRILDMKETVTRRLSGFILDKVIQNQSKKKAFLIMPNNKAKQWFDRYIISLLIYTALFVPYFVCFNIDRSDSASMVIDLIIDFSFFVEILVTFFTAIKEGDRLIVDRVKIAKNYLKGWFFIDILTTFPFQLLNSEGSEGPT